MTDDPLARHAAGDPTAFSKLDDRFREPLYRFLLRMTQNPDRAEDLLQELFLRVHRTAHRYEARGQLAAWLFRIARNLVIDDSRGTEPIRGPLPVLKAPTERTDPARLVARRELAHRIERAIRRLPAEQREVFLLREEGNLPFKEIADLTDAPLGTVLARMHYAVDKLRRALKKEVRP